MTYTVQYITSFYLKPVVHLRNNYCIAFLTPHQHTCLYAEWYQTVNVTGGTADYKTVQYPHAVLA